DYKDDDENLYFQGLEMDDSTDSSDNSLALTSPYLEKTFEVVFIVLVAGSLSLVTIIGNILVMVSIKVNRHLQTVNNYFLFSLACADLIIGVFSMNLYTLYTVIGYWPLGPVVCDLWLALDYVVSNASVMNLLIISFDRYFCVTKPLTYPVKRTTKMAGMMIAAAWVLSFILWAPAILFWQFIVGVRTVEDGECYIQFFSNAAVTFGTAIAAFYLPVIIMTVLYWHISRASKSRIKKDKKEPVANQDPVSTRKKPPPSREKKVTRTILAILLAFIITWAPYNVMVLINTFCAPCIPNTVWTIGYWLCYINSTINPACYALCNATFKKTFKHLLMCHYKNIGATRHHHHHHHH
uniref:Muscarinic acetylcholine receptor M2 n=1 Tax=Homo sapiens TaxID=9606 RepID=UPI0003C73A66|nr:Chain A, Muscarinic acetylcholine receptor M2 [Homo sapiens]4MQT_A Chain A, Muscarinic acetylcholine receptor M2 [Homo sapiens]